MRLDLRAHSVSTIIQTTPTVSTCIFVEMFITVNDVDTPRPPPHQRQPIRHDNVATDRAKTAAIVKHAPIKPPS